MGASGRSKFRSAVEAGLGFTDAVAFVPARPVVGISGAVAAARENSETSVPRRLVKVSASESKTSKLPAASCHWLGVVGLVGVYVGGG